MKLALFALPSAMLLSTGHCFSNHLRLDVTFYTQISPDGGCTRRTEYRLSRTSPREKDAPGFDQKPETDLLRSVFRFPTGDRWTITDKGGADTHEVSLDVFLASPNDLGWDYWRARDQTKPARNHVSFGMDDGEYEYAEAVADPNSPIDVAKIVLDVEEESLDALAAEAAQRLTDRHLTAAAIRQTYETHCIAPLRRELTALASRPIQGPAERNRLRKVLDSKCDEDVEAALLVLSPGEVEPVHEALDKASQGLRLDEKLERAGVSLDALIGLDEDVDPDRVDVQFHATVVMPAPIVRANTCYQGDTAHWDFTQRDLYGRGFEMRVLARTPK